MFVGALTGIKVTQYKTSFLLKIAGALMFVLLALPNAARATGYHTWYVSSLATGTVHDGKSWATAWWDFSGATANQRIDWTQVQPGDTIDVDAGSAPAQGYGSELIYHTPLVVQKSNVTIQVPDITGHNGGFASIQTNNSSAVVIDLSTYPVSNVTIQGCRWSPAGEPRLVPNFGVLGGGTGLSIGPSATGIILKNLQLQWCNTGLNLQGGEAFCYWLMINDNAVNVNSAPVASATNHSALIYWSWIYDGYQPRPTDGVFANAAPGSKFNLSVYYSILGPGLSKTFETNSAQDNLSCYYSLFLDPTVSNLEIHTPPTNVTLTYNISFETPLNSSNQGHSCLGSFTESPGVSIVGNIFYGGAVAVTGSRLLGPYNIQYKISGNTQVLSSSQVNPNFAVDVSQIPNNASFAQLIGTPFIPGNNTPGTAYGMQYVQQLLKEVRTY